MFGWRGTVLLLLGMVGWILVAAVAGMVAAFLLALASGMARGLFSLDLAPGPIAYVLTVTGAFQATLLAAAARQGRRLGDGDRRTGLGAGPVRRKGAVALLSLLMLLWAALMIVLIHVFPALRDYVRSVTPDVLAGAGNAGPLVAAARIGLIALLAPLAEEMFFRGWLWEALRRRGRGEAATMVLTALPWLLLHGLDSPGRIPFLIPAAVLLSLARRMGGSVRASLAAHVMNNGSVVLVQTLGRLAGGE